MIWAGIRIYQQTWRYVNWDFQTEKERKEYQEKWTVLRSPWDVIKCTNICIMGIREERREGSRDYLKKTFQIWWKH